MNHGIAGEAHVALRYLRHFIMLTVITVAVAAFRWRSPSPLLAGVVYSALHATTVALTLREPASTGKAVRFVVLAVVICAASIAGGLTALRLIDTPTVSLYGVLLALITGCGALAYLLLLREFWIPALGWCAMSGITLAAAALSSATLAVEIKLGKPGGLWLAAIWWYAVSIGI